MLLRRLANNGLAILCTLHQPSSQLFQTFDRLLLLGEGGNQLYFGDIGPSASTVLGYFEGTGSPKCPVGRNPAEWIIETTRTKPVEAALTGEQTAKTEAAPNPSNRNWPWDESEQKQIVLRHLSQLREACSSEKSSSKHATSPLFQFSVVLKRNFQSYWRDPVALYSKLGLCVTIVSAFVFDPRQTPECGLTMVVLLVPCKWSLLHQLA